MKRIYILIILFISSFSAFAQEDVQDTFWGVSFGARKDMVKSSFSRHSEFIEIDDYSGDLVFRDGYFAGDKWNFIRAKFSYGSFYEVEFSSYFTSKEIAWEFYESYKKRLTERYSNGKIGSKETVRYDLYNEVGSAIDVFNGPMRSCSVQFEYSRSVGGNSFYYVTLNFYVYLIWKDMYDRETKKNDSEL